MLRRSLQSPTGPCPRYLAVLGHEFRVHAALMIMQIYPDTGKDARTRTHVQYLYPRARSLTGDTFHSYTITTDDDELEQPAQIASASARAVALEQAVPQQRAPTSSQMV